MASLVKTNPHLRDWRRRMAWIRANARDSSAFEGARGLPAVGQPHPSKRTSMRSTKKSGKGSRSRK
jgi:hypothetical protein